MIRQLSFWGALSIFFVVVLVLLQDILLPFVVAAILAYFLDPAADLLEKYRISRTWAVVIILGAFFLAAGLIVTFVAPILYEQCVTFIHKIPQYIEMVKSKLIPYIQSLVMNIEPNVTEKVQTLAEESSSKVFALLMGVLSRVWQSGVALANILSLLFVMPVIAFYILRDWDHIVAKVDSWLPRSRCEFIREQFYAIDDTLAGYVRGQLNVCLILAFLYSVSLSALGLEFGLFIGLATGILAFVPYVGALIGFSATIIVAFFQFQEWTHIAMVMVAFLIIQVLEGTVLTPKLVGGKVGLHPVWIIFGMFAGASLFGFLGVLLALPLTAIVGVLVRTFLQQYLSSDLYDGHAKG